MKELRELCSYHKVTGPKENSFFSFLRNVLYYIVGTVAIFFPLGCCTKKKSRMWPLQNRHPEFSPHVLIETKGATSDALNGSSQLWRWLVISFLRSSSSDCPWPGSLCPWSGWWPGILIHPICCFFRHLQATLLLSQKTSIWQSKVKNGLGKPMRMINYEKSTEDRAPTAASCPRGRRRFQNPWARWWWMKKRYHFDALQVRKITESGARVKRNDFFYISSQHSVLFPLETLAQRCFACHRKVV